MTKPLTGKNIKCNNCEKEFYVPLNRLKTAKYCSRKCSALANRIASITECEVCGSQFDHIASRCNKAKYCSRKCYYKAMHLKGSVTINCHHCGKYFKASPSEKRKYCSRACIGKEGMKSWHPVFTTVRKAMIRRGMLKECNRCGFNRYPKILGVHHIDRNRNNNAFSNLEILCPNCHSIEHMKHTPHGFKE